MEIREIIEMAGLIIVLLIMIGIAMFLLKEKGGDALASIMRVLRFGK